VEQTTDEFIGQLIRRARLRHGMTQSALAARLAALSGNPAVTRDQIARWERGGRVPSPYWRDWLSAALSEPLGQLERAARQARAARLLQNIRPRHDGSATG
jgi:transcriptional regulator with XRE-family HTH domain